MTSELINDEVVVDRRKSVVLGFSFGCGARFARARAVRLFLGLLGSVRKIRHEQGDAFSHFTQHVCDLEEAA